MITTRRDAPLEVEGVEHFVNRNYREGGTHQWVRETWRNAYEAGASRVEFGTEWQGVGNGVWRRQISDNGCGMTPDELLAFFRMYGGSGKPIGGLHENFGVGAKSSLLPWNPLGVVVVSWHEDYEEPSMIWIRRDPVGQSFGLRTFDVEGGGGDLVVVPFEDDELGIDWAAIKPDWIEDHGTCIVLLGTEYDENTVLGDPNRDEGGVPGLKIANYLNRRLWDVGDMDIQVDEYIAESIHKWPRSNATTVRGKKQMNRRGVFGARYYMVYKAAEKSGGKIVASNTVSLPDGTNVDWYLWEGEGRSGIRYGAQNGFVAAAYAPPTSGQLNRPPIIELFDVLEHPARFRSFGISESVVRKNTWLIVRPPLAEGTDFGVYMSSDRNRLLIQGGPRAGDPLPWDEWAIAFTDDMPKELVDAINNARTKTDDAELDATVLERVAARFADRWRQARYILDPKGKSRTTATEAGTASRPKKRVAKKKSATKGGGSGGSAGLETAGKAEEGTQAARKSRGDVGLPEYRWIEDDGDTFEQGMMAVWNPPSSASPRGLVDLNISHPVMVEEFNHWRSQYPPHLEDEVDKYVKAAYAQLAVATIAHGESLAPHLERKDRLNDLRTQEALTAALLGLVGANAIIGPLLGGSLGTKRKKVTDA